MRSRVLALTGAFELVLALAAGCGFGGGTSSVAHKDTLVVGVKADQPGLGLKSDGTFKGFDVDVATYVAHKLGAKHIEFKAITSAQREKFIADGTVDMVVASYSITPEREAKGVLFGGPYYVAHQDTLIRTAESASIHNVHDLKGRTLCNVTGSNSYGRVADEKKIAVVPVAGTSYGDCVQKLTSGAVDAVSTDDLILAGFAAQVNASGTRVQVVNAPFTDENYGIGVKQGDLEGCEDINHAITGMYQDGTAQRLLHTWFDAAKLAITTDVPQFEGCG